MQVEDRVAALERSFDDLTASLLSQDDYVRYERLPQLTGEGVAHDAGSGELVLDITSNYDQQDPSTGSVDLSSASTVDALNVTEAGLLQEVAVVMTTTLSAAGSLDVFVDVTLDGGTTATWQIIDNGSITDLGSVYQVGDDHTMTTDGDRIKIPIFLAYAASCVVTLRRGANSPGAGAATIIATRGVKS